MRAALTYPHAERQPVVDHLHGHRVADPYRWLEDPADPRTAAWLSAQDELWREHAATLPGRDRLHARISELSDVGLVSAPTWRGTRWFHVRRDPGQDHPVLYLADPDTDDVDDRPLVDPMRLDASGTTVLDEWQPDPTGRLLAFQLSRQGTERSALYVVDLDTDTVVDGPIDRCRHSPVAWLPAGDAFFYVRATADSPHARRVYLHRVGVPADDDAPVHGADLPDGTAFGLGISHDGRWLTVSASRPGRAGNDVWLADLACGPVERPALRPVQYDVDATTVLDVGRDGRLYVVTTLGAPRGRLCVADPAHPGPDHWTELVRAGSDTVLTDFAVLDGPRLERPQLLIGWTAHAIGELTVHDLATGALLGEVELPGLGSIGRMSVRQGHGHEVWFTYTDGVTPAHVLHHDASTGATARWATPPGAVELPDLCTSHLVCHSADGTPVRMVALSRSTPDGPCGDGPRPTILYGYGGFGLPLVPTYSSYALAWVEAGGVFVTANVRGGGEGGREWHRAGTRERKQNVVDDFVAAAERLVDDGWTTPDRLGMCGESNGGLLVGAALTQRPDLFAAAVCSAPVLDMVRYERFGLGPSWRGEYGSAEVPEQLGWLLGYSPYHRVRGGVDYPAVLFTVFGGDTRVDPMHARKMCAALQHATARGGRPVLLRHEDGVGHARRSVSRGVGLAADLLAFLGAHTGLDLRDPP